MSFTLNVVHGSFKSQPAGLSYSLRKLSCSSDWTPRNLIQKYNERVQEDGKEVPALAPHIYFMAPALPVLDYAIAALVPNSEDILTHWLEELTDKASRGESGVVFGALERSIPGGSAVLWGEGFSLGEVAHSPYADFSGAGVHAILVPQTLKRSAPDLVEDGPTKKQNTFQGATLPTSVSNETATTDEDTRQRIVERVDRVLDAVKSQAEIDHDPSATTDLPLPSIHADMTEWGGRFPISVLNTSEISYYSYRGRNRSIFDEILTKIRRLTEAKGGQLKLGLFGTRGGGKAHVATAVASELLRAGHPVVFLGFSQTAPRRVEIRDAILLALRVQPKHAVHAATLFDHCVKYPNEHQGVIRFCNHLQHRRVQLFFVALGLDALSDKDEAAFWSMTQGHIVLFTASANSAVCRRMEGAIGPGYSEWDNQAMYLNGGLDENDVEHWFQQYEKESENPAAVFNSREKIQALTGNVPSLLETVFTSIRKKGPEAFIVGQDGQDEVDMSQLDMEDSAIFSDIKQFVKAQSREDAVRVRKILMAAMGNSSEGFNSLELADRRYIYLDAQKRWRYSGEIVFRAIFKLAVELEDCMQYFHVQHWLNCIPLVRNNPAMLDYAIEYALTAELRNGLRVGSKDFFPAIPLRSLPAGGRPSKLAESGIYVPMEFNHRYIDCVAVFLDPRNSTSEITIFQISNVQRSSDHSDSEAKFFEDSGDYLLWQEAMPDDFKLTWNFVWLINTPAGVPPPAPYHKKKGPKITDGPPARTVYTVGIKSVSKAVDDALRSL